jgi:hypothetical protein
MRSLGTLPHDTLRRWSVRAGLATSTAAFIAAGVPVLLDQWISGEASALFMLGTALVLAGSCTGLFAAIVAAGLLIATLWPGRESPRRHGSAWHFRRSSLRRLWSRRHFLSPFASSPDK